MSSGSVRTVVRVRAAGSRERSSARPGCTSRASRDRPPVPCHDEGKRVHRPVSGHGADENRWWATATAATFPAAVRETEEVVPVNAVSPWVLLPEVTVRR